MKSGNHTYTYAKQLNGKGRYGAVELEIVPSDTPSVIDACEWKIIKASYPALGESDLLHTWKQSAIDAATEMLNRNLPAKNVSIILRDIIGITVDTLPSHIGAAVFIGIYDYSEMPLSNEEMTQLNDYVWQTQLRTVIPDYKTWIFLRS